MAEDKYKYALPKGFVLHGATREYVIEEVLGNGGFGITYKVKSPIIINGIRHEPYIAVKEFFPHFCSRDINKLTMTIPESIDNETKEGLRDFITEGKRLQEVCLLSNNIVNVNEVFEANGTAYYVLEYLEGGDLRKMISNNGGEGLSEQQMLDIMIPIGKAVQCLHDNRILHLDVKPDNILMRRNRLDGSEAPVLIDFGIAVHFNSDGTPTTNTPSQGVSPGYSPIEQYKSVKIFDPRFDVYSFSATCLFLLTGKDPIDALDIPNDFVKNVMPANVSENVARAIERGMSKDKDNRINSINKLLEAFMGIQETDDDFQEAPKKKKSTMLIAIIALVAVLALGGYFAYDAGHFNFVKKWFKSDKSSTVDESEDVTSSDSNYDYENEIESQPISDVATPETAPAREKTAREHQPSREHQTDPKRQPQTSKQQSQTSNRQTQPEQQSQPPKQQPPNQPGSKDEYERLRRNNNRVM